jgi:hypothetical protein
MWSELGIADFIIVSLGIWIAAIWILVWAPGTRQRDYCTYPVLIIRIFG